MLILHDFRIDVRNIHVAHAGFEIFSMTNLMVQVKGDSVETYLSGLNLSSFNFNIDSIKELVVEVLKFVN